MSTDKSASWSFAEGLPDEDPVLLRARERAFELGVPSVSPGTGMALSVLAATAKARTAVEIGTGAGVSGVYLLRGLSPQAVLTSIDHDVEHLRAARVAFAEAGVPANRTRTISGKAQDVLPRLTDGAYDLVFVDADKPNAPLYAQQAVRLLKPGGVLLLNDALDRDRVANPAGREPVTVTLRQLIKRLREDDSLLTTVFTVGDGLLAAVKR
ncbi:MULTISPECIES: O-methyltransferase [Arthrobacter]|uniref:O-methyltransferase n=2 Tax=Arthrobacter TaxID=1663 RepID=A0ABU9KJW7_9MICC|nr:O-methyltransferase [Arthrobacter sp. YJM1]MDP5227138.1 O-methyltransferase [Arthrobacter sp. YJM1]